MKGLRSAHIKIVNVTRKVRMVMSKAFVINIPLYKRDLLVVFGDKDYLVNQMSEAYNISLQSAYSITEDIDDYSTGRYYFNREKGSRFLWMPKVPEKPQEYATLGHEIFHAAFGIMDEIGASPSEDSEEAYAYLIGYLTKEIYTSFNGSHES